MCGTERAWWMFQLPESVAHVPCDTEAEAREHLRKNAYRGAPVDSWPCIGSRWSSRARLYIDLSVTP